MTAALSTKNAIVDMTELNTRTVSSLVSVGIPVFNGVSTLRSTVENLLQQDYANIEIIISDNASTDGTGALGEALAQEYTQVRYSRNAENLGSLANFDHLFTLASGKYFLWCGHHDEYSPGFIKKAVAIMESDETVVSCVARKMYIGEGGDLVDHPAPVLDTRGITKMNRFLTHMWHFEGCTEFYGVHRKEAIKNLLPLKRLLCLDLVFLCELAAIGSTAYMPEELLKMQVHPYDILKTLRRHGFTVNRSVAWRQYILLYGHLVIIACRQFSPLKAGLIVIPSITFCMLEKFKWLYIEIDKGLKAERIAAATK